MVRGPVLYRALFYQIWVTKSPEAASCCLENIRNEA